MTSCLALFARNWWNKGNASRSHTQSDSPEAAPGWSLISTIALFVVVAVVVVVDAAAAVFVITYIFIIIVVIVVLVKDYFSNNNIGFI